MVQHYAELSAFLSSILEFLSLCKMQQSENDPYHDHAVSDAPT
jgi:hypothetical protein